MSGVYVTVFFNDIAVVNVDHWKDDKPFAMVALQTRGGRVMIEGVPRGHADSIAKAFADAMTPDVTEEPLAETRAHQRESEDAA